VELEGITFSEDSCFCMVTDAGPAMIEPCFVGWLASVDGISVALSGRVSSQVFEMIVRRLHLFFHGNKIVSFRSTERTSEYGGVLRNS
jgi:hypothetical protein